MNMVEKFFSVRYAGREELFKGLAIWEYEKYRMLQGTYPVINLSFANVKETDYQTARRKICQILSNLYAEYEFLFDSPVLGERGTRFFRSVSEDMDDAAATMAIHQLSLYLSKFEVKTMFRIIIKNWFSQASSDYNDFIKALLLGDVDAMNEYMDYVTESIFSSFDVGKKASLSQPERFYHGFVLGLMVELADRYVLTSNRESGFERYDVMLEPLYPDRDDGMILEFKVFQRKKEKVLEDTVKAALKQIEEKRYEALLTAKGIPKDRIRKYGFAFRGKDVLIGDKYENI